MSQLFDLLKYRLLLVLICRLAEHCCRREMRAGAAADDVAKLPFRILRACVADCFDRMAPAPTVRVQFIGAVLQCLVGLL